LCGFTLLRGVLERLLDQDFPGGITRERIELPVEVEDDGHSYLA
jgi:hypothetical protein